MILLLLDGPELYHVRDSLPVRGMGKAVEARNVDVRVAQDVLCSEGTVSIHQFPTMRYTSLWIDVQFIVSI